MAITINTQIVNQVATAARSYAYLYEPLKIVVTESDLTATKLFVDIEVLDNQLLNLPIVETLVKYAEFDINPGKNLTFDMMKLIQQHHNSEIYRFANITDILNGWKAVITENTYKFKIYTDKTLTPVEVTKIPIIGGRSYQQFNADVTLAQPYNEFEWLGINADHRWLGYPSIKNLFRDPNATSVEPAIFQLIHTSGKVPCGGYLIWKSRFGGWMHWGFDIRTDSQTKKYVGKIEVGMFESTQEIDGNPFVPVDYVGVETSNSLNLKSLSLSSLELQAVAGITSSPAVYYMKDISGELELMKLDNATAPQDTNANGGDFSVSLSSISNNSQRTR